jgi:hypothetical protein
MLWIGLTLFLLSLTALPLALRARITARGTFCRRCRFDLSGADPESKRCPECGSDLGSKSATRPTLRRASPVMLKLVVVLMLTGIGMMALRSGPASRKVLASLPTRTVFSLADQGWEPAMMELHARLTGTNPIDATTRSHMIDRTLARQTDPAKPWDARWGDLLAWGLVRGSMTDDQIVRYFRDGLPFQMVTYEVLPQGRTSVPVWIRSDAARGYAGPRTGSDTMHSFSVALVLTGGGFRDSAPLKGPFGGGTSSMFAVPASPTRSYLGMGTSITVPADLASMIQVGDTATSFFEIDCVITRTADEKTWSIPLVLESNLRIVPPDQPMVRTITAPAVVEATIAGTTAGPIQAELPDLKRDQSQFAFPINPGIALADGAGSIAGRLFLRSGPDEFEFATCIEGPDLPWSGAVRFMDREEATSFVAWLQARAAAGTVDLVFRSDPTVGERPPLMEVVGVDLIFPDVPLVFFDPSTGEWPEVDGEIPAQKLTEFNDSP